MKKKFGLILLCFLMVFAAGCGDKDSDAGKGTDEKQYTSVELAKIPENLKESTYEDVTAGYDADKWVYNDMMGIWTIYEKSAFASGADQIDNVNLSAQPYSGKIDEDFIKEFKEGLESQTDMGMTLGVCELRDLDGQTITYYESETVMTEAMLDLMIENGNLTEEDIEALGGREALTSRAAVKQVGMHALVDGNMLTVTGTYSSDKERLLEAMNVIIQTAKVK